MARPPAGPTCCKHKDLPAGAGRTLREDKPAHARRALRLPPVVPDPKNGVAERPRRQGARSAPAHTQRAEPQRRDQSLQTLRGERDRDAHTSARTGRPVTTQAVPAAWSPDRGPDAPSWRELAGVLASIIERFMFRGSRLRYRAVLPLPPCSPRTPNRARRVVWSIGLSGSAGWIAMGRWSCDQVWLNGGAPVSQSVETRPGPTPSSHRIYRIVTPVPGRRGHPRLRPKP
jgi:hypothetical protein